MIRRLSAPAAGASITADASRDRQTCSISCRCFGRRRVRPQEIYNLAAMSFVPASIGDATGEFNAQGVRAPRCCAVVDPKIRIIRHRQRAVRQGPRGAANGQRRSTPEPVRRLEGVRALHHSELPRKLQSLCRVRMLSTTNHRARPRFVSRVTNGVARIKLGLDDSLPMGVSTRRDWCRRLRRAMWPSAGINRRLRIPRASAIPCAS